MIKIHPMDTDEQAQKRHDDIVRRLDELGPVVVRHLFANAGFPTQWDQIVLAWLKDK